MMPNEKIAQFSSAPPLNRLNIAARLPPVFSVNEVRNHSWITAWFTPGVVIAAPRRTITIMASVNRMRRRSSGILTVFKNAETIDYDLPVNRKALALLRFLLFRGRFRRRLFRRRFLGPLRFRLCSRFSFRGFVRGGLFGRLTRTLDRLLPQRHAAARLLDFFPRRCADLIGLNRERVLEFAIAENLQAVSVAAKHLLLTKK